ncbi:MAG: 4Fe-4S binding protein [Acidobacteriota bacterium]
MAASEIAHQGAEGKALGGRPKPTATRLRRLLQLLMILLVLAIGVQFSRFVASCLDPRLPAAARPPGVGGFLPIAGLMGLRHWFSTGRLDAVQPSAAVLLLLALLASLVLKKSFCAWLCPVGTLSEWLWRLRAKLLPRWPAHRIPRWLDGVLMAPKYLLLAFFAFFIVVAMPLRALEAFIEGPYNRVADVRMLAFFAHPSTLALAVLAGLLLLSFLVQNAWCRYLCPYGALTGLVSLLSPLKVRRVDEACTHCKACTRACPMHLKVHELGTVRSPECTACLLCVDACPEPAALVVGPGPGLKRPGLALAALALVLLVYFGGIALAMAAGHWRNGIDREEYLRIVPPAMQRYPVQDGETDGTRSP